MSPSFAKYRKKRQTTSRYDTGSCALRVHMYARTHARMHTHTHARMYTHTHTHTHTHVRTRTHTLIHTTPGDSKPCVRPTRRSARSNSPRLPLLRSAI